MFSGSSCAGEDAETNQSAVGTLDLNTLISSAECPTVTGGGV